MDQSGLFDPENHSLIGEELRLGDSVLTDFPCAFSPEESQALLEALLQQIPWRQESLWIAGQQRAVPRLQCWMGDAESLYGYSGMRLTPEPWHPAVLQIKLQVEELSKQAFNSVLLNLYRDGSDSVAWHADDEKELGEDPVIASVSLGAERPFQLKRKAAASAGQSPEKHQIMLRNGSILIMGKGIQNNWLHQVPKVKSLTEPRINLTFRQIQKTREQ